MPRQARSERSTRAASTGRATTAHDATASDGDAARLADHAAATLAALVAIPSVSGEEDAIRRELRARLDTLGLAPEIDAAGNLIAALPGDGTPLLLNAHMDRVPPGRGHTAVIADGRMRSDGTTNLGADDAAGLAIILTVVEEIVRRGRPYPPLVLLFTVGEEVGLRGASAFDPSRWGVTEGLVFDNAGAPGAVVTRGATYVAFDAVLRGRSGHPGKDLAGTVSAIEMLRRLPLPLGSLDGDSTRVSLGTVAGGTARNAIPAEVRLAGEVRTFLGGESLVRLLGTVEQDFLDVAAATGGEAECAFDPHCPGYTVAPDEPLLAAWRTAWEARGHPFDPIATFIGSDAHALRRSIRALTVSTGVEDEHTTAESIPLAPLGEIAAATLALLAEYRSESQKS
ncbi:MAG TPA: M20/M25/M40 family metallo-hydrolase [Ktedonobacterales bacterium]|jgi:tripeptide aminopeptidase